MPFQWTEGGRGSNPDGFRAQHVAGIRERARLLYNLRFDRERAIARIQRALDWEFDTDIASTPRPTFYDEVPSLVDAVYAHASRGKGGEGGKGGKKTSKARRKRK